MEPSLKEVLSHFQTQGEVVSCERYGCGHINETYLAVTDTGRRYILQKLSNRAFPDIAGLQENVEAVTKHLHSKSSDPRAALTLIPTDEGKSWVHMGENSDWRMYDFVEDSLCLQAPECPEDFYQSAIAFGTFQQQLADFPAETLHETIHNFHNTPDRYRLFREALDKDTMGRAASVQPEVDFVLAHEAVGGKLAAMLRAGELPLRVTHNDTKLNNILLDKTTGEGLCVIDLDTVMPGLAANDFGDSIRFGANHCAEDEADLSKVNFSMELFEIYTKGFLQAAGEAFTPLEKQTLPWGAKLMTMECGMRFLSDYLEGDHYFHINYEQQNLNRARTQFKLTSGMEENWDAMQKVIEKYC